MIPAVVLAAGKSTRMGGRTKALLPVDGGETFIGRIVRVFREAGVREVVVVVGHEADRVERAIDAAGLAATIAVNGDFESGQFSSVLAGLRLIDRPEVDAFLLMLVDVPMVSAATVQAVLERYRETHAPVVRPVNGDLHGHPVLIDRSLFDDLKKADSASGAKPVVRRHVSAAGDVPVDDLGAFRDVDTPADYDRLLMR